MSDIPKLTDAVEGDSCPPTCSRLDAARLQWILDHVTNLECTENVAGNLDKFLMPATREDIDREMRGTSPMLGQCTCGDRMCGCLTCPIHGQRIGNSSANV
jgi:hypothetical protein